VRPEKSGGQMVVQKHDFEGKEKLANWKFQIHTWCYSQVLTYYHLSIFASV
jgi:hypothetical protein